MLAKYLTAAIITSFLTTGALTARAATPKEAVGFRGTVTGTVKSARSDGMSFVLTATKAEAEATGSDVKDTAPMVGKDLTLGVRMPRKDNVPYPSPEDVAFIKSLKAGATVTVKVFAVHSDHTVLRIDGPGTVAGDRDGKDKSRE